ncbi:hypothetical protein [Capnocytophaga sp.]|uniref:hypothetical protein n=1 Tax=Capnocytophaga sp. TaxID=44737 RepID=UPI0026DBC304|nr:hypothetical protein [Capnocytophaga sp.]MDO5104599.1 hypothetical protein [Capnocytophaga sp.]
MSTKNVTLEQLVNRLTAINKENNSNSIAIDVSSETPYSNAIGMVGNIINVCRSAVYYKGEYPNAETELISVGEVLGLAEQIVFNLYDDIKELDTLYKLK